MFRNISVLIISLCILGFTTFSIKQKSSKDNPQLVTVMDDLAKPWSIAFLSDNEALVTEKEGNLLQVNLTTKQKTVIKNFPDDLFKSFDFDSAKYRPYTYPGNLKNGTKNLKMNAAMFEVLLDPDFKTNKWIYISYVSAKADSFATKVIRAKLVANTLTNIATLFLATPYAHGLYHFGGGMIFGKDKKLYITMGERLFTEGHEPAIPIAQNLTDKRGKIFRINPDGSIPDDNPDYGSTAVKGLYAVGIRAAQGLALNNETGVIWFSEHGTNQGDEINILKAAANYGWPVKTTGTYRAPDYEPPVMQGTYFTDPVWYWKQTVAPTGLCFYTGNEFPQWKGNLLVPGLSGGSLWRVVTTGEKVKSMEQLFIDQPIRLRKAAQSPDGKLYLLTDEDNGRILRIKNN